MTRGLLTTSQSTNIDQIFVTGSGLGESVSGNEQVFVRYVSGTV